MLGHMVMKTLLEDENMEVFDVSYRRKLREETRICDVSDFKALEEIISDVVPDVIVNCVGILISGAQKAPARAIALNSLLPHFLVSACHAHNARLIHISTDCVFSGKKGQYSEDSFRDADDVYGRSKALGEIDGPNALTLRTSIIGPEIKEKGEGLIHWFLTTAQKRIQGFSNVYWGGVTTLTCSRAIQHAIREEISGLWNLTNGEAISKYDLLKAVNATLPNANKRELIANGEKRSDKSLKSSRDDIQFIVPSYEEMLEEMMSDIQRRPSNYPLYRSQT